MRCHHRHTHGTPLSSPDKPPKRADKNGASIASPLPPDNRHEKANERKRVSDTENPTPPANTNHARHGKPITTPAPPPTRRAGDYMKSADKREPARGGRAKDKRKIPHPISCVEELTKTAHSNTIAHHHLFSHSSSFSSPAQPPCHSSHHSHIPQTPLLPAQRPARATRPTPRHTEHTHHAKTPKPSHPPNRPHQRYDTPTHRPTASRHEKEQTPARPQRADKNGTTNEPTPDTPKRTNETRDGAKSEAKNETEKTDRKAGRKTKREAKRSEERNEKRGENHPQYRHQKITRKTQPAPRHKKMKNEKIQVAGQQAEPIKISMHEYVKYMDMGEYGNMGKICGYEKDTKKSYRFIHLMI